METSRKGGMKGGGFIAFFLSAIILSTVISGYAEAAPAKVQERGDCAVQSDGDVGNTDICAKLLESVTTGQEGYVMHRMADDRDDREIQYVLAPVEVFLSADVGGDQRRTILATKGHLPVLSQFCTVGEGRKNYFFVSEFFEMGASGMGIQEGAAGSDKVFRIIW